MTLNDIEKLPAEFDFVSRINMSGIVYHARETKIGYVISWEASDWNGRKYSLLDSCDKIEFWKKLKVDDYVPVNVKEKLPEEPLDYIPKPQPEPLEEDVNYRSEYLMIRKMYELTSQYMSLDGDLSCAGEASDLRDEIEELAMNICREGTDLTDKEFCEYLDSHNPKLQKKLVREAKKRSKKENKNNK